MIFGSVHNSFCLLAFAPPPQPGTAPNPTGQMVQMLVTFLVLGLMFYFVMIRPQQKKAREHADLLKNLKSGDKILTSGGILGVVVGVKDKTVSIRSADTKLEVLKSAVSEITERAAGSSSES
jgi:preprotein translocase subunit YajC